MINCFRFCSIFLESVVSIINENDIKIRREYQKKKKTVLKSSIVFLHCTSVLYMLSIAVHTIMPFHSQCEVSLRRALSPTPTPAQISISTSTLRHFSRFQTLSLILHPQTPAICLLYSTAGKVPHNKTAVCLSISTSNFKPKVFQHITKTVSVQM
jgi:hypothetical protein